MRPSTPEQLAGMARILEQVVAPEVGAAYPRAVVDGIVDTLRVLAAGHDEVPGFLAWDLAATTALLARAGIRVDDVAELGAADDPGAAGPDAAAPGGDGPDRLDLPRLAERHERVRAALEAAVPQLAADPELRPALLELFAERGRRFPFAFTPGAARARPPR